MARSIITVELVLNSNHTESCKRIIDSSFSDIAIIKSVNVSGYTSCPYNKIKGLYNKIFEGKKVRFCYGLSANRKKALKERWNNCGDFSCGDLDWWRNYFSHIKKSPLLMGEVKTEGRSPFKLSFDWVINESNTLDRDWET